MDSRAAHVRWLIAQHRGLEAVPLVRAWIDAHPDGEGLEPAFARTGLARAQLAHGDAAAAWTSIEPALVTWQGGAMEMGVLVLVALGRTEEALALVRRYATRYHGVDPASLVAEVLWIRGDHAAAALALPSPSPDANLSGWNELVGAAVVRVFAARPPEVAGAAAIALVRRGIGVSAMESLVVRLDGEGHASQALAVHETIRATGLRSLALFAVRHRLRAHAASRAEADRWLEATVPPSARAPVAMFAFGDGDDALVHFAAESAVTDAEGQAFLWLLRSAAWLRSSPDATTRARLDAALSTPTHPYHHMARYLLGAEPLEAMMALATDDDRRTEVSYWAGYRAHCEGRLEEAAEWYRFVARRGPMKESEVGWARRALHAWSDEPVWLDAVVDPWAQAHSGTAPTLAAAPAAPDPPRVEVAPDRPGRHRRHPGGHPHHRRHPRRPASGARS